MQILWSYAVITGPAHSATLAKLLKVGNKCLKKLLNIARNVDRGTERLRIQTNQLLRKTSGDGIEFPKGIIVQDDYLRRYTKLNDYRPLELKVREMLLGQDAKYPFIGKTAKSNRGILVNDLDDFYVDTSAHTLEAKNRKMIAQNKGKPYVELDFRELCQGLDPARLKKGEVLNRIKDIVLN